MEFSVDATNAIDNSSGCVRLTDVEHPVVCMDKQPAQLVKETREPLRATREYAERVD